MENVDQKTLYVAVTPSQAADLFEGQVLYPKNQAKDLDSARRRWLELTISISGTLATSIQAKKRFPRKGSSLWPYVWELQDI